MREKSLETSTIYIMRLDVIGTYVFVFINYFSRMIKLRVINLRKTEKVISNLKDIYRISVRIKLSINNALEFIEKKFNFCTDFNIRHHLVTVGNII